MVVNDAPRQRTKFGISGAGDELSAYWISACLCFRYLRQSSALPADPQRARTTRRAGQRVDHLASPGQARLPAMWNSGAHEQVGIAAGWRRRGVAGSREGGARGWDS